MEITKKEFININNKFDEYKIKEEKAFEYIEGKEKIIVSAPHSVRQIRNGNIKGKDSCTGTIAILLQKQLNCYCLYKTKNCNDDANYDIENNPYKDKIIDLVEKNNINFLLDIHGAKDGQGFDIDVGTANLKNLNGQNKYLKDFIKIGEKYNGTLNSNSDKDFWKITATKKGYIKLSFGHDYIDDYHGWNVYVYQYVNGEYKELSSQTISLKDNKLIQLKGISAQSGGIYYVTITNYNWNAVGVNYTLKAAYSIGKPYNLRGTISKRKITLKWDRGNAVNGYEVYCKVGNGKYKKIANTLTNSYTYKKLSKKKTCYFKVRSYVINNGVKEYSGFTAVVKARA